MEDPWTTIEDVRVPRFMYGTAWKEDQTSHLTEMALRAGFRGIDTANQRKHYDEAGVGRGIAASIDRGIVSRDDLFLQSKFTFRPGQDARLPFDANAPIQTQVAQSFANTCENLGTTKLDAFLLHGPSGRSGLREPDWMAWRAMEEIHDRGSTRLLGVSNVSLEQLERLCFGAKIRPHIVQNRCYAVDGWDRRMREYCRSNNIVYQGFSLLTANTDILRHSDLIRIAKSHHRQVAQIVFRFALQVGMVALTGTTNVEHMQQDLSVFDVSLLPDEIARIENIGVARVSGKGRLSTEY